MEDHQTPLPEDPQARIQALLDRMDLDERYATGQTLDEQRLAWQKAWYLRFVIGPFLAGQLFDLWQWILGRVDNFLWSWAEQGPAAPSRPIVQSNPTDPREALRKALREKPGKPGTKQE